MSPGDFERLRRRTKRRLADQERRLGALQEKAERGPLDPVEDKLLEHELALAAELQANLLPQRIPRPPGWEFGAYYKPSHEVGGDYYDFLELDSDHLGLVVADVSGKGIPGSIVMTETRALLKSEAARSLSPAEVLRRVNRTLHPDLKRGMFVSMIYAVVSLSGRTATFSVAGHPPGLLWRAASGSIHEIQTKGLALGIDRGPFFEKSSRDLRLELAPGDRLVLYTDGIPESMNAERQLLGDDRFRGRVRDSGPLATGDFLAGLLDDLQAHQGDGPQHDDITVVTARVSPEP